MIKAYVTGGAKCGGGGKMPKSKKAEEAMTTKDYSSLAQSHVILATQRFDKIGDRLLITDITQTLYEQLTGWQDQQVSPSSVSMLAAPK